MSKSIENRVPTWTSVRLGLAVVAACNGTSLGACGADGENERAASARSSARVDSRALRSGASRAEQAQEGEDGEEAGDEYAEGGDEYTDAEGALQAAGPTTTPDGEIGEGAMPYTEAVPAVSAAVAGCGGVDWSQAPLRISAPAGATRLASLSAQLLESALCVRVTGDGVVGSGYNLLVETDGKLRTGMQTPSWVAGAEYWVTDGVLRKTRSPLFEGDVLLDKGVVVAGSNELVFQLPRELLNVTVEEGKLGVGFQLLKGFDADVALPAGPALAQLDGGFVGDAPDATACEVPSTAVGGLDPVANPRPARSAIDVRKGVIAPLYLGIPPAQGASDWKLDEKRNQSLLRQWGLVSEAAAAMTSIGGPSSDFWAVLNGPASGPPAAGQWDNYNAVWKPVGVSGGRLFGYVHTVQSRMVGTEVVVGPTFRPLADVENEITAWVQGLEGLDGIWLDEFIPRFEIADGTVTAGTPVLSPNPALAPLDPNVGKYPANFGALQVDPTCGYYDRLTRWIRASYPWLRIIGNPGSPLQTNQRAYARLVDVLVGFEKSLAVASENQWAALARGVEPLARANLALIHAGDAKTVATGTREQAVDAAFAAGFTHVYATDALYQTGGQNSDPNALGNHNVWGNLPEAWLGNSKNESVPLSETSALHDEVSYVAGKP